MKIIKIISFLSLLPAIVFAQKTTADSLYIFKQDRQLIDYVQQNGTQLISSGIEKLSTANIKYQTADGHFRTLQTAETGQDVSFGTSGIATLGRFKIFGDFRFTRIWQDSLGWSMKGMEDESNPYYFAAIKAGAYQRINYAMNALAVYRLIGDKVYLANGINYMYNSASRSVDPRPSVQTFRFILTPELIYKGKHHTLGANILWGYEHENNTVGYRNVVYSSGLSYPDRILYQVFGYGSFARAGVRSLRRKGDYIGGGVNYAYAEATKYLRAGINYKEHNEEISFPLASSTVYKVYGNYYLKQYDFSLLAGIDKGLYRYQLTAKINYTDGKDKNADLNASSYKYQATSAAIGYSIQSKKASSVNTELGINALYYDQSQRDLSASHTFNFTYVQPGLQASLYKKYNNAGRLKLTLAPGVRLPVNNMLNIPAGELDQTFNNTVTYPDYSYYTSTVAIVNSGAEYVTPHWFKGVNSSIAISSSFYKPLSTGKLATGSTFKPSGSFLTTSFSFNIYF